MDQIATNGWWSVRVAKKKKMQDDFCTWTGNCFCVQLFSFGWNFVREMELSHSSRGCRLFKERKVLYGKLETLIVSWIGTRSFFIAHPFPFFSSIKKRLHKWAIQRNLIKGALWKHWLLPVLQWNNFIFSPKPHLVGILRVVLFEVGVACCFANVMPRRLETLLRSRYSSTQRLLEER